MSWRASARPAPAPTRRAASPWTRAGLLLAGAALAAGLWWFTAGAPRLRHYHPPDATIAVPSGAAAIARGRHLAEAVAVCTICHGEDLAGKLAFEDAFLGRGYTANLTPGGVGARYSDADWVRAIRFGVKPDGTGILFMPSDYYTAITDADLGALIAYLRSLPRTENPRTALELGRAARLMLDLGLAGSVVRAATIDPTARPWQQAQTPAAYLIRLGGCAFCHGAALQGGQGPEPGAPGGPRLRRRGWSEASFAAALRGGQAPDGHRIDPKYMPWQGYARLDDAEVHAIWAALEADD